MVVVDQPGLDPVERVDRAVRQVGAARALAAGAVRSGVPVGAVPVVIVPEVEGFELGSPSVTDPRLVEALVDTLHDIGCDDVVCGFSADTTSRWAGNRDVHALADLLGYRFTTTGGRDYDVVDLGTDLVPAGFPDGGVLAGSSLASTWLHAGFRVVFAANRTDPADGYHLALRTVLRALPMADEHLHYRVAADGGDVVRDLLARTPVDLVLVDAIVSCDGSGGAWAPHAVRTDAVVACDDIWLADAVGATRMGLDPGTSPLFAHAPSDVGVALDDLAGRLDPWPGFVAPDPLVLASTRARDATPTWPRLLRPWLQVLDAEAFPLASPLDDRLNRRLAPVFADVDRDVLARGLLVTVNGLLATFGSSLQTYRTLFDKDAVRRTRLPLGFDPDTHDLGEFDAILPELERLAGLLSGAPERAPGLRWRMVGGATVFDYVRVLPIPFDDVVATVDVARTISLMNDYVGGVVVELAHDDRGRPVRQAERNRYLPQPNWMVLWGGDPIDVGKLEVVSHEPDRQRLAWKTVTSDNDSAVHDDGIAEFARVRGGTRVTILGRQQFTLPPALAGLDLDLVPDLRAHLVTDAYRTFFDRTLANIEATAEGRDVRVGRPLPAVDGPEDPLPSARLEQRLEDVLDWFDRASQGHAARDLRDPDAPMEVDAVGFTHVAGRDHGHDAPGAFDGMATSLAPVLAGLWSGLAEAALRDLETSVGAP